MRRVKLHAFQWKRRAGEFFKDFDLLNSGRRNAKRAGRRIGMDGASPVESAWIWKMTGGYPCHIASKLTTTSKTTVVYEESIWGLFFTTFFDPFHIVQKSLAKG